jgi:CubicO group peptidase (beta-lactamase class C family)
MQGNDIRGAALAVAKDTKLVFAHGYTWAESEYPITQPTTLFRLASCSKPITGIAINQLIENGSLSLDDKAQDILKMKQPNGTEPPTDPKPSDPNTQGHYFHAITVRNLLQHQIGWGDLPLPGAFDPMWNEEETQKAFNLPSQSLVTKYQIASWAVSQKQFCWPGTRYGYCNFGYILLGMIVEKQLGMSYINAVQEYIAKPLNLKHLRQSQSILTGWPPPTDEAYYHYYSSPQSSSPDLITLDRLRQSPPYTEHIENWDAAGGLSIAATDYAKLLAALNLTTLSNPILKPERIASIFTNYLGWDQSQPDPKGGNRWFKGGSLDCCATSVCHSMSGFSYALFYNRGFAMDPPKSGGGWPIWPDLDTGMSGTTMSSIDLFSDPSINLGSI